jgi:hypothetical protein
MNTITLAEATAAPLTCPDFGWISICTIVLFLLGAVSVAVAIRHLRRLDDVPMSDAPSA